MNNIFPILGIETSSELCSAALIINEDINYEINIKKKHSHSEKLFDIIDNLFVNSGYNLNNINSIAVSMGPGSFTGLRIGLSAVKGIALGSNLPIIPVPSFDALALQISNYLKVGTLFNIINEVNREQVYFAKFVKEDFFYFTKDKLSIVDKNQVHSLIDDEELIFGDYYSEESRKESSLLRAIYVAKWAYIFGKDLLTFNYDYLEPNYLKKFVTRTKK
ncbi:tRNA (adenosine(37)-N6)-threonylcarbamoyltransferase complex dimerization subunit type 1 TsaB [Bacteroidota bacterium]